MHFPLNCYAYGTDFVNYVNSGARKCNIKDYKEPISDIEHKSDFKQYSKITKDSRIIEALKVMENSPAKFAYNKIFGNNPTKENIKVIFKDLEALNPQYKTHEALGWKKGNQLYIYINPKHATAPKEALCTLIAGRAIHDDEKDSINEEVESLMIEAMTWDYFVDKNPELENEKGTLVKRENYIRKIFLSGNKTDKYIRKVVKTNPSYKNLPETSPGFED